ncbi:MAG TPA: arginase family protein [Steroidobacteraceae bacterium]|nr:arginase family protein [Steroidobacteraceae bacterium]
MAAAEVCGRYGPLVQVPEAGEGEARGGINRWTAILEQFRSARALLEARRPRRILTAGGDCSCDVAVIDYLRRQYPELTVIWVDAHLDANTAESSPSGNFHGMPVAAIMGAAPAEMRADLTSPLPPARFRYVSAHAGDPGDWDFQRQHGLRWLEPGTPVSGPVHVHFDLDVFDPAEFAHLAYLDGKLPVETGVSMLHTIARSAELVGLTITEFAPVDEPGAQEGNRILERLCDAATGQSGR